MLISRCLQVSCGALDYEGSPCVLQRRIISIDYCHALGFIGYEQLACLFKSSYAGDWKVLNVFPAIVAITKPNVVVSLLNILKTWSQRLRIDSVLRFNPPHVQIWAEDGCFSLEQMRNLSPYTQNVCFVLPFFSIETATQQFLWQCCSENRTEGSSFCIVRQKSSRWLLVCISS